MSASSIPFPSGMGTPFSWNSLLSDSYIDKNVQSQLSKVYLTLTATVLAAALGSAAYIKYNIFTNPSAPSILTCMIMMGLVFTKPNKNNLSMRLGMLFTFGFLDGCIIGNLVHYAIRSNPSIVVTAFLSTTLIFFCFSISALTATRRSMLYLGGILSSALIILTLTNLANVFFQSKLVFGVQLYLGLFVFCGFILFDTQLIIEQIKSGNADFVMMALNLFVDFVAIFVRILIILLKDDSKQRQKDKRRRR